MQSGIHTKLTDLEENQILSVTQQDQHAYAMQPLKIALVTETWPPELNGVALSILQLVKRLQQRGHRILLIRPQQQERIFDFVPDKECLVRAQAIPKYHQMQFGWPQVFKLGKALDEFMPDIVHIVTEGPLGLAALNQAKQRKVPVSSGFHSSFHDFSRYFDLAFLLSPVRRYLKWFHNQTDVTCVPSQDTMNSLVEFGVTCPMRIVGRGVDHQRFSPTHRNTALRKLWQATQDTTVLLCVGRVSPEKDLPCIFEAYEKLKITQPNRKLRLVIVGDGPVLETYQHKYPDVIFMGAQVGQDLADCYASSDVFVFSSQIETFGNVVLEAMASGLPVLAYDAACAGQMIDSEQEGWLIPLGERAVWQEKLTHLPPKLQLTVMGEQAREKIKMCGWDQPVADFEKILIQYAKKRESYALK